MTQGVKAILAVEIESAVPVEGGVAMSISELGSLGEFVSSIAVVVTLIFLGTQIRHSNILAKRNELNIGHSQSSQLRIALAENGDLAEIMVTGGTASANLSPADKLRFDCVVGEVAWSAFHIWDRARLGLSDDDVWSRHAGGIAEILLSPGGSVWWTNNKDQFPEQFRSAVEESASSA